MIYVAFMKRPNIAHQNSGMLFPGTEPNASHTLIALAPRLSRLRPMPSTSACVIGLPCPLFAQPPWPCAAAPEAQPSSGHSPRLSFDSPLHAPPLIFVGHATSFSQAKSLLPLNALGSAPPPFPTPVQVAASSSCAIQSNAVPTCSQKRRSQRQTGRPTLHNTAAAKRSTLPYGSMLTATSILESRKPSKLP